MFYNSGRVHQTRRCALAMESGIADHVWSIEEIVGLLGDDTYMKTAALFVALLSIVVGIVGLVSPEYGTMVRRQYFASPATLYPAVALRLIMGLVVILAA